MKQEKFLSAGQMFAEAWSYWKDNNRVMWLFASGQAAFAFLLAGIGGWTTEWFLLWGILYYAFAYAFFRRIFDRRPYVLTWRLVASAVPAVKIVFLVFLSVLVLGLLPFLPYVMNGVSLEVKDNYTFFLKQYMQDSQSVDLVLSVLFAAASPFLVLRPLLAWLGAVIGRSGSIVSAFARTKGNYFPMLAIMVVFQLVFVGLIFLIRCDVVFILPAVLLAAPVSVFFYLVASRVYVFFFLS